MDSYDGRTAVITGGASGIGFATAQEFARRGARLMLADINETTLNEAVANLRNDGVDVQGVVCDCRKLDDVVHLADEAFLPRLIAQPEDSHIVFTSSFAGLIPNVGLGPYCVAKYGVVALAETLSREVRANGIGVSVLCPMIVETDLMANSERVRSADYGPANAPTAETVQQLASAPQDDSVLQVDDVARLTADAILANRLYIVPHQASRASIQRRFERIDRAFDEQIADGWTH